KEGSVDRIFSGRSRIIVLLCIGVFVLACGQGQPQTAATFTAKTEAPTATVATTAQPTPTDEPTATPIALPQVQLTRAVNLREGPGTNYPVIRAVAAKTTVDLLAVREENGERWYRVRVDDDEGWMSASVVTVDDAVASALPVDIQAIAPPPTATPKPVAAA